MNPTIDLMHQHSSVRRFTDEPLPEADLKAIINAGRAASSWKNFQSYSIIVVRSEEKKRALYDLVPQEAIRQAQAVLLFVGDHYRASKAAELHGSDFDAKGPENLLISSVDAGLAGQNTLLAAESLGYGGVIIGMLRQVSQEISDVFHLPDYTYPVFAIALGHPNQNHPVKPRLAYEAVVFEEEYQPADLEVIKAYDQVQSDYAGARQTELWSERLVQQFGQPSQTATQELLEKHKLL